MPAATVNVKEHPSERRERTSVDLITFAAKLKPACFICGIPERDEIETAWTKGIRSAAITAWLVDARGYAETDIPDRKRVEQHFHGGHMKTAGR